MRSAIFVSALALGAACGGPAVAPRAADDADEEPIRYAIALRFEDGGVDAQTDTPHTRVLLVRIGPDGATEPHELSREPGVCQHETRRGALIAAQCWWAGAGARFTVVRRGERVVAERVALDEQAPSGEAREVGAVEVPEGAELDVVAPGATLAP